MTTPRWRSVVLLLAMTLASTGVAYAQSKPELQMQQDIRMLQEQIAQLRIAVNALAKQGDATKAQIDSQNELLRTNNANQADALRNIQSQVDALAQKLANYAQQIDHYASEVTPIRTGLEQQQKVLDRILSAVEVQQPTATANADTGTPPTPGAPMPASPAAAFNQARGIYFSGDFEMAVKALEDFLKTPDAGGYAAEANYLLGMSYMKVGKLPNAVTAFKTVTDNYATADKASDSYYQLGEAYAAMGKAKEAQAAYAQTIKLFPDSSAAALAKTRIK